MRLSEIISNAARNSLDTTPEKSKQISAKVYNPLLFESPNSINSYEACNICNLTFAIGNRTNNCKECNLPCCNKHLVLELKFDVERICVICYREKILIERNEEVKDIKDQILEEIQIVSTERQQKTVLIKKETGNAKKLRKIIKLNQTEYENTLKDIQEQVVFERNEIEKLKEETARYEGNYNSRKFLEEATSKWLVNIRLKVDDKRNELISSEKDIKELEIQTQNLENIQK